MQPLIDLDSTFDKLFFDALPRPIPSSLPTSLLDPASPDSFSSIVSVEEIPGGGEKPKRTGKQKPDLESARGTTEAAARYLLFPGRNRVNIKS
jgi:hypothetical protein